MRFTYYGHAAFTLTHEGTTVLFDPFITNNPWQKVKVEDIHCQYIFISHGHDDHYGDAEVIAKANDALIISTAEIAAKASRAGCRSHALHIGGCATFPFGYVRLTPAFHGAGIAGGLAAGCLIQLGGKLIYYAGDTGLYSDMKLHSRFAPVNCAILPIGDNFTMGIEDAAIAASWIQPKFVIPVHYGSWPLIDKNPKEYKALTEKNFHIDVQIVEPGTSYEF